jgi:hypothetical protein
MIFDKDIRLLMNHIQKLRVLDDSRSTYFKLELIKELTKQCQESYRKILTDVEDLK